MSEGIDGLQRLHYANAMQGGSGRSPGVVFAALLFCLLSVPSAPSGASGPDDSLDAHLAVLDRMRTAINSVDFIQETTWEDARQGEPPRVSSDKARIRYRRDLKRLRRDRLAEGSERTGRLHGVEPDQPQASFGVVEKAHPLPEWLAAMPDMVRGPCLVIKTQGRVAKYVSHCRRETGAIPAEVTLNPERLPVRVVTFGAGGGVLDERTLAWQAVGAEDWLITGERTEFLPVGPASLTWDGRDIAGRVTELGVYRVRFVASVVGEEDRLGRGFSIRWRLEPAFAPGLAGPRRCGPFPRTPADL